MRKFFVVLSIILIASPVFAYKIDNVIVNDSSGNQLLVKSIATSISSNTITLIQTSAQALGSSTAIYKATIKNISSPSRVYIGGSDLTTEGYILEHAFSTTGNTVSIETDNLADIYVSGNSGGLVSYIIEKK